MRLSRRESGAGLTRQARALTAGLGGFAQRLVQRPARRLWQRRSRKVTAVVAALSLAVALGVVAVVVATSPSRPGPPVQQAGTAAGRSHRVPAASTMATVVNGKVVPEHLPRGASARAAAAEAALREVRAPKGAVQPASTPPKLKLGAAAKPRDKVGVLPAAAAPAVKGFNARSSKVVEGQTSTDRVVYQNADGTRTAQFFNAPVNYKLPNGSWASVNTRLVPANGTSAAADAASASPSPSASSSPAASPSPSGSSSPSAASPSPTPTSATQAPGGWREEAAPQSETFAPYADDSPLLVMPLGGSHSVGLGVADAARAPGGASGSAVSYAGVRPDAGLRLVAGAGLADVQVVLDSASAPDSWVFPLRLDGLRARMGPDGTIGFTSASGHMVAFMPHGVMTDSDINRQSGDGAASGGVSYALTTAGGQPAVEMTLDAAWLDSPSRVFPVTADASVQAINSGGTTYVESGAPGNNSSNVEIKAGTWDGGTNVARSLLNFSSVGTTALSHDTVLGADLGLFNTWSYSCSARPVDVYPVTSSWSTGSNAPTTYPGPSIGPEIGSKSFATGWVPLGSTQSPCPAAWEGIPLNEAGTQLIDGWTQGTTPNDGLALGASSTDSYGWKKFASDNATNGDPFLSVTYTPYGASYKLASSQPVTQVWPTQNGKIAITVTNKGSATWTPTNGYELSYVVYNSKGQKMTGSPEPFTPMPYDVAPDGQATVDATVNELPVGNYVIDFDMYANATTSPESFLSQGIAPFPISLSVPQPPPVVTSVYPPNGYISSTATPELSTTAFSTTSTPVTYQFSLSCQPLTGSTCPASAIDSPSLTVPYWTPTTAMTWNEPYTWTVKATTNGASTTIGPVTITPEVPQPDITSGLGGASGQAFDPQSGNFTTSATDAAISVAGPSLEIDRTYNSLDPRTNGAFGAGWSSVLDTAVIPDNDGSGNVVLALPDGQQIRFGYNTYTGTYTAPPGSPDVLVHNSGGTWTLMDSSGDQYEFTSGGTIEQITNPQGLSQDFTVNSSGEVTAVTDAASGRSLTLAWATPSGAASPHVASVTTSPAASGGAGLTWAYSYSGDELSQVCDPSGNCTSYTYGTGSNYRSAVLDSGPRNYWELGDASGSATAADEVDTNLGTTGGAYSNVTLGASGPLAGSSETAASFNGTSSYMSLPANLISDQADVSVGLWFKAASSSASGVLFSYSADAITNSSGNSAAHVPALYVGGNGELYGELWNGSVDPMHSSVNVDDGNWHYAVLTGSATSQSLWLDGTEVGTLSGQISPDGMTNDTVGAGFWESWPEDYITEGPALENTAIGYFDGSIGQVAVYPHPLGQPAIAEQYGLARKASPELTQVTLPSGRVYQQVSYDNTQDRVASYTDPNGGQWQISQPLTTGYKGSSDAMEAATRSVTVTTPAGYDRVYSYDAVNGGRLISFTPGNGDVPETFGYDAAGFLNQVQDSDGNLVTLTNDIHGNVLSRTWYMTEPGSSTAGNRAGPAAPATSASSYCTATGAACTSYYTYYYDTSNPLDPRNNELTGVADARSASSTDTTYLTTYAYNAAGELTSSTTPATSDFPSGRTTGYTYSTSSTAAYGGHTTPPGLLLSITTPGGAVTSYAYYSDGDLAQVTQSAGATTRYTYDGLGRALTATTTSETYPGGLTTGYTYTPDNQPLTVTYPGATNQLTGFTHTLQDSYAYDADGNLLSLTQSDLTGGDAPRVTSYTYNDHGEVASVTQPAGATTGGGTQSGGASSANPEGATTGYSYNDSGLIATMTDPNGNEYDYTYNEYGKVTQTTLTVNSTSESLPGGGSSLVLDSYGYDQAGLLGAATDAMGRTTIYEYYPDQQLATVSQQPSSGANRMTSYLYDPAGNLTETDVSSYPLTTADQSITDYSYDAANRLTSMVAGAVPSGASGSRYPDRTTSYAYNADNQVTSQTVTGVNGPATTDYGYNSADEMTSQSVVNGSVNDTTTWTYDQLGQPTSMTSPDGNASGATPADYTSNYAYNQAGSLATVTGPPTVTSTYAAQTPVTARPASTYGYDTFGDQTQTQDPDGNLTTTGYDGDGRVVSVTQPSYTPPGSSAAITATTEYGYDEDGNLTSVTDPKGNTTSYGYDALNDVISQTDPQLTGQSAPGVWTYTYDSDGEELTATSPTGGQTQATYDSFGDQITATQDIRSSSGTAYNATDYTYDYLGDPLTVTTPDQVTTTNTYDSLGELASTENAAADTTSYAYNYAGELAEVIKPDGTAADYGYNGAGSLDSVTDYGPSAEQGELPPVLATETMGYDPSGNETSVKDPDGNTTTYAYNAAGEPTSQVQPVSSSASDTTSYGYDPAENQTSRTDPDGNTTWTTYNAWNLPESVTEPATATATTAAQRTWTTAYSADGQPVTVSQPGGITLSYGYDQLGDLTSESGSGAPAPTPSQTFGYDLDGDLTSAAAPGGTDSFTYNDAGQVTSTAGPSGTASFGYNPDGLMTSRTDAAGTTSYTYDTSDRLATAADPLTGATLSYGYNADSLPASISYSPAGEIGLTQSLGYSGLQQLTSDTLTAASGATIASASDGYDADGNLTSQATTGYVGAASTTYGYNRADELTSATTGSATTSYGYDADGDLTQAGGTTYSYNAQDQPVSSATSAGTTSYGYTLSGALASVTPPSGSAQDYTSNAYGQTATAPGGISYAYDGLGRLATRTTGSGTADFAYSGTGHTLAASGGSSYSHDPSGNLIASDPSGGSAGIALADVHGDVTGSFSPATSTTSLTASAAYSPYGAVTATSGTMPSLGYQGQYTDPSTGDTDMSARWYAPSSSTFTSSDSTPAGMPDPSVLSPTAYGYADGDPLTNIDLTGHCVSWLDWLCSAGTFIANNAGTWGAPFGGGVGGIIGALGCSEAFLLAVGCAAGGFDTGYAIGNFLSNFIGTLWGGYNAYENSRPSPSSRPSQSYPAEGDQNWAYGEFQWCMTYDGNCGQPYGESYGSHTAPYPYPSPYPYPYPGYDCYYGCYAPPPPPPPPPPQDCYAGPNPTCHPPAAPKSLRDREVDTQHPGITTSLNSVPRADRITQPTPTEQQLLAALHLQTAGITSQLNENGELAASQDAGGSTGQAEDPVTAVGVPAAPQAPDPSSASPVSAVTVSLPTTTPTPPASPSPVPDIGVPAVPDGAGAGVPAPDVQTSLAVAPDQPSAQPMPASVTAAVSAPGAGAAVTASPVFRPQLWASQPPGSPAGQNLAAGTQLGVVTEAALTGLPPVPVPGQGGGTAGCMGPAQAASLPRCAAMAPGS